MNIELFPNRFKLVDGNIAEQLQHVGAFSAFVVDSELKYTLEQPDTDARSSQHKMSSLYKTRQTKTSSNKYNQQDRQEREDTQSRFDEENINDQYGNFAGGKGQRHHGKGQRHH